MPAATKPDPSDLLELALDVATRAGSMLSERRPPDLQVQATKSSPTDVVTEMDTAAERLIVQGILAARPEDGLLGEEGAREPGSSGVRWVIDPVDGTVNYLYGLPGWAVSVGAQVAGKTVAGVVVVPSAGETFVATRGGGATRNGEPIRCRDGVALDQALVSTGFGYDRVRREHQARVLLGVLPRVRDIRRLGAFAADLCAVACGRLDAHYERGAKAWDLAAAALIASEAGVRVEGLSGAPAGEDFTLAATPALFPHLHDLLADLDPERS